MKMRTIQDLVDRLKTNARVIGMVRYGSRSVDDRSPGGDFDLFVFIDQRPTDLESIHFHVGDIPVDMSLRTIADLHRPQPIDDIDSVLLTAEILYDPTNTIAQILPSLGSKWKREVKALTEHEIHFNRFCQQHVLDKVRGRLASEPLLCDFLLSTNIYWLIQTYFRVRLMPYPGENGALEWLKDHDGEVFQAIHQFYAISDLAEKLSISEHLTSLVLAPIQGGWKKGEILAFGHNPEAVDIETKAQQIFSELLG